MDDFVEGEVLTLDEEGAVEVLTVAFQSRTANKGYNFSFSGKLMWGRASREELTPEMVMAAINRAMGGENAALDRAYYDIVGGDDNRKWFVHAVDRWEVSDRWEAGGVGRGGLGGWGQPRRLRCPRCGAFLPRVPNVGLTDETFEYHVEGPDGVIRCETHTHAANPRWKCKRCGDETREPVGLLPDTDEE